MHSEPSAQAVSSQSVHGLAFRPDIQGLRAIAILAVVACHAGWPLFAGGFVGVDIFFVISGYLITGLLFHELQATGKVDLPTFYARRLKRLLPALMLVLGVTLLLARVLRAPFEQVELARASAFAALWISNVYFALDDSDYFEPDSFSEPVLHTWSLGVEEQFYLVWPLLLMAAATGGIRTGARLKVAMLLVCTASFALCLWWSYTALPLAFYLMFGRAWQFALGALAFLSAESVVGGAWTSYLRRPQVAEITGAAGLAGIAASVVLLDETRVYPGYLVLLPTLAAALVLHAGRVTQSGFVATLLTARVLQGLGAISYSWYLWHWPVFVFGEDLFGTRRGGPWLDAAMISVSLALALLTWAALERPLRNSARLARKPALTLALSIALAAGVVGGARWMDMQAQTDSRDPAQAPYLAALNEVRRIYDMGCDDWYYSIRVVTCRFGDGSAKKRAVLVGDSVGVQWFSALVPPLAQRGWTVDVFTKSGCPIVQEPLFYERVRGIYTACALWLEELVRQLEGEAPDVLFIGSSAQYTLSERQWQSGTDKLLARLAPVVDKIYLIRGTFALPYNGIACVARNAWQPAFVAAGDACSEGPMEKAADRAALAGLQGAIGGRANVFIVDPTELACPQARCAPVHDGLLVYRDRIHLTEAYVQRSAQGLWNLVLNQAPLP